LNFGEFMNKILEAAILMTQQFVKQNWEQSINTQHTCMYRGPNNTKCAAGALIDDTYYHPSLEKKLSDSDSVVDALANSGWPTDDIFFNMFVRSAQQVHDNKITRGGELKERWQKFLDHEQMYHEVLKAVPELAA